MNQKLAELTEKLSEIGTVEVIKDDYTFTLLMTTYYHNLFSEKSTIHIKTKP